MIKPYYQDEWVTIYHGDCREILPSLEKVDLVLTDPPYKLSQSYGTQIDADNLRNVASILLVYPLMSRLLKEGRFLVSFYDNRILPFLFEATKEARLTYLRSVYLYRRWGQASKWGGWMSTTDPICLFRKPSDTPIVWGSGEIVHDFYTKIKPEATNGEHPAQKPLFVLGHIVSWCSLEREIVLDPYLGSGSTAVACKSLNRKCIGIEIEEKYCEIATKRCSQSVMRLET